jgi:hypothetical protein
MYHMAVGQLLRARWSGIFTHLEPTKTTTAFDEKVTAPNTKKVRSEALKTAFRNEMAPP